MKGAYTVPQDTRDMQAKASDPRHSAWVSAHAGSGKTHVLSQRVIRLLLDGVDPSRVLCLTYTRAAAANMSNRVFSILSEWAMLDNAALAEKILDLDGRRPDDRVLVRARQLFARALETPGGLKIQTIHAFCESILHQFPLEANIAAHFELLDPLMEAALFASARREMLTGIMAADTPGLVEAFAMVLERGGEAGLDDLLKEIVRNRDGVRAFIDAAGIDEPRYATLFEEFGFDAADSRPAIAASVWPLPGFEPSYFAAFASEAQAVEAASVVNNILPGAIAAFAEPDPERRLRLLCAGFLKADGDPYDATKFKKALLARMPDLPDRFLLASQAIIDAAERLAMFRMLEATVAALTVADWLVTRYEQLKAGRGFLDFNDLIMRTVRLLSRSDVGPWVQYKLDKGIDHILIDEAQDTSPSQWTVVKRLAEEFFAGLGARDDTHRTVFAVGDEKQSIYSFQGAAPESFGRTGWEFSETIRGAERGFERVELKLSFRSTEDVLKAVDRVFAAPDAARGLTFGGDPIEHNAIRVGAPGHVELWPSLGADVVEEPDDWSQAIDHASAPAVKLAEAIASTVKSWIETGEIMEGRGRAITPGDVLVLVRKRGSFVNALSRGLKTRGIAVAGADRLSLTGHIAVKDMMALGRCLIQPEDDLSLAAVLRSPVFGFSDDQLFAVSAGRGVGRSLMASLRTQGSEDEASKKAADQLSVWASEAAFQRPFEFYSGVLGRDGVRARMIARLGQDAGDILDEMLNFCLAQEQTGMPGLDAFLATLENAAPEIKREMDQGRDEVRIMTVHAAKGLEAPIVFLVDGGADPFSHQHLPRLMPFQPKGELSHVTAYLWRAPGETPGRFVRAAEQAIGERADDEYRRLLYVGMTRAEDRLIVCGYHGRRAPKPTTWHSIVSRALVGAPETVEMAHPGMPEPIYRFRVTPGLRNRSEPTSAPEQDVPSASPFPEHLRARLPPAVGLPRPLAPSGAASLLIEPGDIVISGRSPVLEGNVEPGLAIARGLVLHKLLQMLPGLPEAERRAAAARYLDRAASGWPEEERRAIGNSVFAILDAPAFAPLFGEAARAEVAIVGTLDIRGEKRLVAGKIDRLVVTDDAVMIVDYKTNRPVPASLAAVPPAYVVQLSLYRALLAPLYPGKTVCALLLFTEEPRMIALPASVMDDALARIGKA